MKKYLFYVMRGQKMCFVHVLLNAMDLQESGHEVKIIFEGESVQLPKIFEEERFGLYMKAKEKTLFAGVCYACSLQLGVLDYNEGLDYPLIKDMNGHAGMKAYLENGFEVITF
ncbi:MAG: hypothetical protein N4A76_02770 [Firmicutes bacterium]|jgi:hypothetical protein|nr:hypothetical protein [Bacillota bacterium]